MTGEADTVLADGVGTATADTAGGGDQSATATYVIVAAALTASKVVAVIATDGAAIDCALDPALGGAQFAAPGACIEYTITAANAAGATADADSIDIGDTLPDDVAFVCSNPIWVLNGWCSDNASVDVYDLVCRLAHRSGVSARGDRYAHD